MKIDDPGLSDAMRNMKPGDRIEIEGTEDTNPITIGVPSLERPQNMFDYIVEATDFDRDVVKSIVFALVYGNLARDTIFDVAKHHKLEIQDISMIRGAADEWLTK